MGEGQHRCFTRPSFSRRDFNASLSKCLGRFLSTSVVLPRLPLQIRFVFGTFTEKGCPIVSTILVGPIMILLVTSFSLGATATVPGLVGNGSFEGSTALRGGRTWGIGRIRPWSSSQCPTLFIPKHPKTKKKRGLGISSCTELGPRSGPKSVVSCSLDISWVGFQEGDLKFLKFVMQHILVRSILHLVTKFRLVAGPPIKTGCKRICRTKQVLQQVLNRQPMGPKLFVDPSSTWITGYSMADTQHRAGAAEPSAVKF